jgi:hypothetical protein
MDDQEKYDNCVRTNKEYANKVLCVVEGVEQQSCSSCPYHLYLRVFGKYQRLNL